MKESFDRGIVNSSPKHKPDFPYSLKRSDGGVLIATLSPAPMLVRALLAGVFFRMGLHNYSVDGNALEGGHAKIIAYQSNIEKKDAWDLSLSELYPVMPRLHNPSFIANLNVYSGGSGYICTMSPAPFVVLLAHVKLIDTPKRAENFPYLVPVGKETVKNSLFDPVEQPSFKIVGPEAANNGLRSRKAKPRPAKSALDMAYEFVSESLRRFLNRALDEEMFDGKW